MGKDLTKQSVRKTVRLTAVFYVAAMIATLVFVNACNKSNTDKQLTDAQKNPVIPVSSTDPTETSVVTIAAIRASGDGTTTRIMFNEKAQVFSAGNAAILASLQQALKGGQPVTITTDPWSGQVIAATTATNEQRQHSGAERIHSTGMPVAVDLSTALPDAINNVSDHNISDLGIMPTDTVHLINMVPDIATARLMFTYIAQQCCALPGPYAIDYCIPFQYAIDGCYARAHKMCWILNHKYHYGTQKIFSFANLGYDELCVKGDKWGGCCVNWWYHVAPLVTVKTPQGPKAYVFDPAMFDQPVLLSVWLGAQQNGTCVPGGDVPHVSMYTVQPTSAYWPADGTGMDFDTDPYFTSTDYYLHDYANLHTCP